MDHDTESATADPSSFADSLKLLERGLLDQQLGDELADLVEKVKSQQKQGSITLKLIVKPDSDDDDRLKIAADFTSKPPKLPRKDSIVFREANGALTRNYPGQTTSRHLGGEEN